MADNGLKGFLHKAFDIRRGELGRALLMQLNIFLIILTLLIAKPTVNGMFVSRFGADGLPRAYILVALFAIVVSTLYSRLMSRSSLFRMIIGTFVVNVVVLAGFGILLNQDVLPGWELYLIYIWVAVFGVFSASQFWILANILFNAREAKRLFGFIGAGAIFGGILGGYVTHWLAPRIGSENMLFVAAALLFSCIPITIYIWKRFVRHSFHQSKEKKEVGQHVGNPLAIIRKSRHLTHLAAIIGVSVIVAKLVDYQYSDIAAQRIPEKDQLTAFFGFWFSNFSIFSLLVQLFLTRWFLSRLGVGGAMLILPGGILLGAVALLFFPELWAAVLIKGADSGLKQSVSKAATELLNIPIPLDIKKRTKTFIDVVVDSVATGIGGLILIFLVRGLNLPTAAITLMIILLILIWAFFVFRVRKDYLNSFRLHILHLHPEKHGIDLSKKSLLVHLQELLESGKESERLWVLEKIEHLGDARFCKPCEQLLDDPAPAVRAGALRALHACDTQEHIREKAWTLTRDSDPEVQVAAFNYLVTHESEKIPEIRDILLEGEVDYRVLGPVVVTIAAETSHNPELRKLLGVEAFIADRARLIDSVEDPDEKQYRKKMMAEGIGQANIPETFPYLEKLLQDSDPEVVQQAILAAGHTGDPRFVKPLAAFLAKKATRSQAIQALVEYGPVILDYLRELIADPETDKEVIRQLTEVAERLESPEAVEFLFQLSDHPDQGVQIEALRSLTDLKRNFPAIKVNSKLILERILNEARLYEETLSILYAQTKSDHNRFADGQVERVREARNGLINLLKHRLENHYERILRLLGLRYSPEDLALFFSVRDKKGKEKEDMQANAIEFLENLLHPNLKRVVIPIVESALTETITEEVLDKLKVDIPQERECFEMLLDNNDVRLKLSIFYLIEQMNDPGYLPLVEPYTNSDHPKVRDYATRVYAQVEKGGER